jgi:hypothetical protein
MTKRAPSTDERRAKIQSLQEMPVAQLIMTDINRALREHVVRCEREDAE